MKKIGIGAFAKQMKVSVRTLQYYDTIGLLKPNEYSAGKRRFYTAKESVTMYQIKALKELGFSLNEIHKQLIEGRDIENIKELLNKQKEAITLQIDTLQSAYDQLCTMAETLQEASDLDYEEYMKILEKMYINPTGYWAIAHMDETLVKHIEERFGESADVGLNVYNEWNTLSEKVIDCINRKVYPNSTEAIAIAKSWWDMVLEFTGGDMKLLKHLEQFELEKDNWDASLATRQEQVSAFLQPALEAYFEDTMKESA